MFEWIGFIFSSVFVLFANSVTHNPTFAIISQQLAPAVRKTLAFHGGDNETRQSNNTPELSETSKVIIKFIASVFAQIEPVVSTILELTALQPSEEHLLDVLDEEPTSPTDTSSSDSSTEDFPEEDIKPKRARTVSFSMCSTERETDPPPNDAVKRPRSKSCIGMGCFFEPSPKLQCFSLNNTPSQPLRLKAKRQSSRDNLLTKLGKNHINRKLVAIKDLYPLLNLRQPPMSYDRQVKSRRSDEDLSFLEDMHKVMHILSMSFSRPSHSYDVSRIITIPSLADVLVSEEHLLKAGILHSPLYTPSSRRADVFVSGFGFGWGFHSGFMPGSDYNAGSFWSCSQATLDIVAQFEVPIRRNSRGLGLNGGFGNAKSGVHPSLVKLERDARLRTLKDSWITWGLARRPDVTAAMRHELEELLQAPIIVPASPVGCPAVHELPIFTAVVKEGLRRRSAAVSLEKSMDGYVQDTATATMLAAAAGQTRFADPQTYDPARWLPTDPSKLNTLIPRNQSERDKTLANMQIFAVTPPIVRRTTGDISSSSIDLVIITPKPKIIW